MTMLAEKLKDAGADTVGAQFTAVCTQALRDHPSNLMEAWRTIGLAFGYEFLRGLAADMRGETGDRVPASVTPMPVAPKKPPLRKEIIEKRERVEHVIRSRFKNSAGIAWSDVGWHELPALARDGKEAASLLQAGPANVPNDGRTVGQVLGVKQTDAVIEAMRGPPSSV